MDTNELKKMLKNSTAVLILDNGEPSFVILGYDSYKNLLNDEEQEKEIKVNHLAQAETVATGSAKINTTVDNKSQLTSDRFQHRISEKETELLEKINKEILSLKNEIDKEEKGARVDR